jgi:NADH:ubiquinone oxidoreductase subunit F (NADH-binding)
MIFKKFIAKKISTVEDYRKLGGIEALLMASRMENGEIVEEIKKSGLRGRGGAGFPTGLKWEMVTGLKWELGRESKDSEKYVVCNADEGEVGAFKDRAILENCPYLPLEGLVIAGLAIGSNKGYLYLRDEYQYMHESIQGAIEEIEKTVLQPNNISFSTTLREGAGAYICGEETSMIESLEEKRGEPRLKPPYPPQSGLFGKPTIINNVETISNVPWIIREGAEAFSRIGTEMSNGTKLFSVSGDVKNPGVYELTMGEKLRDLVTDYAGAEDIKAIQLGGASGRIIAGNDLDRSLCFEDVLGSGAVIVLDNSRSIVHAIYDTMSFFMEESCGKCTPCREGNYVITELLKKILKGRGCERDLLTLREISTAMMDTSFCGLGIAAPRGLLDSLKLFEDEYKWLVSDEHKHEIATAVQA